jgi:late competence protein required for DNA uptake (superfamily II DNA/RNA helicase)
MNQLDILSSARTIRKLDKTTISSLTPAQLVNGLIVLKAFPEVDLKKELATRLDDSFKMDVGN